MVAMMVHPMRVLVLVLGLGLQWKCLAASSYYSWLADNIVITGAQAVVAGDPSAYSLNLQSNRQVIAGSYRLSLVVTVNQSRINTNNYKKRYYLNTTCIPYHSKSSDIQTRISDLLLRYYTVRIKNMSTFQW